MGFAVFGDKSRRFAHCRRIGDIAAYGIGTAQRHLFFFFSCFTLSSLAVTVHEDTLLQPQEAHLYQLVVREFGSLEGGVPEDICCAGM